MGKGARLKRERKEGLRGKSGRWDQIPVGHRMVIPTFDKVKLGAMPVVIPSPGKHKGSAQEAIDEELDLQTLNSGFADELIELEKETEAVQGITIGEHDAELESESEGEGESDAG